MRWLFCSIIVCLMLSACSPRVTVNSYPEATATRLSQSEKGVCQIPVYSVDEPIEQKNQIIGEIRVDDSGFSVDCGKDTVMDILRKEACKAHADAVIILKETAPDWLSSCYRVQARLIQFTEMNETSEKTAENSAESKPPGKKEAADTSKTALKESKGNTVAASIFGYAIGYVIGFALVAAIL